MKPTERRILGLDLCIYFEVVNNIRGLLCHLIGFYFLRISKK